MMIPMYVVGCEASLEAVSIGLWGQLDELVGQSAIELLVQPVASV